MDSRETHPSSAEPSTSPQSARHGYEEQFGLLAASVKDYALIMLDTDGSVSDWNIGAERLTGYRHEHIVGRHVSVFYSDDARRLDMPAKELATARAYGSHESENWCVRQDGSQILVYSVITALRTEENALRGYVLVVRDVSSREELEERFRRVVEAAPNAMLMINTAGRITMLNLQAERVFGYSRSELLGKSVETVIPERFRKHHPGMRDFFFAAPSPRPMGAGRDLYALRKDGSEFPVEIGLNPIDTEDGPMVLSAVVDISDRKSKEESIQEALHEKDILLGEIHHRVKNNLQIVHSLLDLQSGRIDDPTVQEMLKETQNRIQSMALIHQTLYQSQNFSGVDFGHFLDNLVPMLSASYGIDPRRITLAIDAAEVLLPLNMAIPCGLVVNELITNSLKHAFPDSRTGRIDISLSKEPDGHVRLVLADDGVGIPESVDFEKTGSLGLKLVTLLAEQLAGELDINRAHPTRFSLRFPMAG
ncbi:MAG TPA: PAS domain S-box protein [Gammaproteobacteria bacterium]